MCSSWPEPLCYAQLEHDPQPFSVSTSRDAKWTQHPTAADSPKVAESAWRRSIVIGSGAVPDMVPGSLQGLQLGGGPRHQRRLRHAPGAGVDVSDVQVVGENPRAVLDPLDNVGFVVFAVPTAWLRAGDEARAG